MKASERRMLPNGRLALPVLGLGCAPLGGLFKPMAEADAAALVDAAWQRGVRLFDTAPFYGYTQSERRLGAALRERPRDAYVLSTKVGRVMQADASVRPGDDHWAEPLPWRPHFDYTRHGVLRSFDDSLQRLGLDRIDMLYVHDIGTLTHGDAHAHHWHQLTRGGGFRALEELRRSGAVAAVGLGVNEWQVALAALDEFDVDCTMLAGRYTLLEQASLPFLDACVKRRSAVVVAGPFNSGVLVGGKTFDYAQAPANVLDRVAALQAVCDAWQVPLAAAALQFPLAHPAVISCAAGAHHAAEVVQNIACFETAIPADFWQALRDGGLLDERAPLPSAA